MARILICDPLNAVGVEQLRAEGHQVTELAAEDKANIEMHAKGVDALIVRSGTQATSALMDAAGASLRVIGRAGVGVDNVDVKAATERGILVVNAPTANLLSATEHTFALLLALMRKVPAADRALKESRWDRKSFVGKELWGKTLGIAGFGRIGQRVALRAQAFEMKVLAYDPFLDDDAIRRHDVEPASLEDLLRAADAVTLHVPMAESTRNLINAERIALMKDDAVLINCARGGVIDEPALLAALESGKLAGAGLDVFAEEPMRDFTLARHPKVVATPHVGAQTQEAQLRIAQDTAKMVNQALAGSLAVTAVNLPFRPAGSQGEPFLRLATLLGRLASELLGSGARQLDVILRGVDDALEQPIAIAALKGLLSSVVEGVNVVNASRIAEARGIEVVRTAHGRPKTHPFLVGVRVQGANSSVELAGTLVHDHDPRIVRLDDHLLEFQPKGYLLVVRNDDVPGVVGRLGSVLGEADLNIAEIHLSRKAGSNEALAVVRLDERPDEVVMARITALEAVRSARLVAADL
jgi:D-3-phosphoglycerate dehydrogenase